LQEGYISDSEGYKRMIEWLKDEDDVAGKIYE